MPITHCPSASSAMWYIPTHTTGTIYHNLTPNMVLAPMFMSACLHEARPIAALLASMQATPISRDYDNRKDRRMYVRMAQACVYLDNFRKLANGDQESELLKMGSLGLLEYHCLNGYHIA